MKFLFPSAANACWPRARRVLLIGSWLVLLGLSACGGSDDGTPAANDPPNPPPPPLPLPVDRGPTTLAVADALLNGLYWDAAANKLYLSDEKTNALRVWDGGKGFAQVTALPAAPASGASLGQVTGTSNGTLYVTRFGFGTDGTVIAVPKSGAAVNLSGLDAKRRRIAITTTADGALIDSWFIKGASGALSELTLDAAKASEKELITGLGKPVGLAVAGDKLFINDQQSGNVLVYSLAAVRAKPATLADAQVLATFTTFDGIDLMTAASDGTLFFGGSGGKLFAISPKGEVKTLVSGWPKIRGVAYDEAHKRLLVAVTAADASSPPSLRIVPVD